MSGAAGSLVRETLGSLLGSALKAPAPSGPNTNLSGESGSGVENGLEEVTRTSAQMTPSPRQNGEPPSAVAFFLFFFFRMNV